MRFIGMVMPLVLVGACHGGGGGGGGGGSSATYLIGGVVSGLSGEIVVQNNSELLTIGASGSFTFPTQLQRGASYAVAIQTQPATQKCLVSNGTGVAAGNVTNVQVSCSTLMSLNESTPFDKSPGVARSQHPELYFSADIDPSTVNGANIILSDGSANVSTTFSVVGSLVTVHPTAPLKQFTDYTLSVSERVRGQGREVLAAPVTIGFSTNDIAWDTLAEVPRPVDDIAMDEDGNVLAVWRQSEGVGASLYVPGSGWDPTVLISGSGSLGAAQIEFDRSGNAIAFWTQTTSGKSAILVNRYVAGAGWGAATTISDPAMHSIRPHVAFDATGNAIAVWQQSADSNQATKSNAFARFYSFGVGWGAAASIQTDTSLNGKSPAVAVDRNGNAIIVWIELVQVGGSSANNKARDSRYAVGTGVRLSETLIPASSYGFNSDSAQVQVDDAGNGIFLSAGIASHYSVATGWEMGVVVIGLGPRGEQLAVNGAGDAFVVSTHGGPYGWSLWSNHYTAGTGWQTPTQLWDVGFMYVNGNGYAVEVPQIAIDAAGNGIAVWGEVPDGPGVLFGPGPTFISTNRYVVGSGWGTRTEMAADLTKAALAPLIAANAAGDAFMVWRRSGATPYTRKL